MKNTLAILLSLTMLLSCDKHADDYLVGLGEFVQIESDKARFEWNDTVNTLRIPSGEASLCVYPVKGHPSGVLSLDKVYDAGKTYFQRYLTPSETEVRGDWFLVREEGNGDSLRIDIEENNSAERRLLMCDCERNMRHTRIKIEQDGK